MTDSMQKIVDEMRAGINGLSARETNYSGPLVQNWADRIEAMMKEPVATILPPNPYDGICGVYLDSKDWRKLETLPTGTKLFLAPTDQTKRIEELERKLADANLPRFTDEPPDDCPHGSQCMHTGGCFGKCSAALSQQEGEK